MSVLCLALALMSFKPEFLVHSDPEKPINNIASINTVMANKRDASEWLAVYRSNDSGRYNKAIDLAHSLSIRPKLYVKPSQTPEQEGVIEFYAVPKWSTAEYVAQIISDAEYVVSSGEGYDVASTGQFISARPHYITLDPGGFTEQLTQLSSAVGWSVDLNIQTPTQEMPAITVGFVTVSKSKSATKSEISKMLPLFFGAYEISPSVSFNAESKTITIGN